MYKLLVFISLVLISSGKFSSQITLETTYSGGNQKLFMVELEVSGPKYVFKNVTPNDRYLKLYNLDHSLWKTIDCNAFPLATYCNPNVDEVYRYYFYELYISEHLFNCDDKIEFMYILTSDCHWFTGVYNEDGEAILEADSCAPLVSTSVPQHFRPIYNTPEGAKMILSDQAGDARVYQLPCTLTTGINQSPLQNSEIGHLLVYPNPANSQITIKYQLPISFSSAEIVIYDQEGDLLRTYAIDRNFSELLVNSEEFSSGIYFYSLRVDGVFLESRKIIQID